MASRLQPHFEAIIQMRKRHMNIRQIANHLTAQGLPTKRQNPNQVQSASDEERTEDQANTCCQTILNHASSTFTLILGWGVPRLSFALWNVTPGQ